VSAWIKYICTAIQSLLSMKILIAEYASALGLGGTCELEGRAMLATLASSFERAGHEVLYPTFGPVVGAGRPILIKGECGILHKEA